MADFTYFINCIFYLMLIFGSFLFYIWALLASTVSPKYSWANSLTLLGIILFIIFTFNPSLQFLNPLVYLGKLWNNGIIESTVFYGLKFYNPLLAIIFYIIFSFWMLTGIKHHLTNHWDTVFNKKQIISLFIIFLFIFWGFYNSGASTYTAGLMENYKLNLLFTIALILITSFGFLNNESYTKIRTFIFNNKERDIFFFIKHYLETLILLLIIFIVSTLIFIAFFGGYKQPDVIIYKFLIFFIFSLIYFLAIYLINLWPGKNQNSIIVGIFAVSLIIPIPFETLIFPFNPFDLLLLGSASPTKLIICITSDLILLFVISGIFYSRLKFLMDKIKTKC